MTFIRADISRAKNRARGLQTYWDPDREGASRIASLSEFTYDTNEEERAAGPPRFTINDGASWWARFLEPLVITEEVFREKILEVCQRTHRAFNLYEDGEEERRMPELTVATIDGVMYLVASVVPMSEWGLAFGSCPNPDDHNELSRAFDVAKEPTADVEP